MKRLLMVHYFFLTFALLFLHFNTYASENTFSIFLIEYVDYLCQHCRNMQPIIDNIIQKNRNIKIIYRPIGVMNPYSKVLAKLALAAKNQNKFVLFHDALMASSSVLTTQQIIHLAELLGLSSYQLFHDSNSDEIMRCLENNLDLAKTHDPEGKIRLPLILLGSKAKPTHSFKFVGEVSEKLLQISINSLSN